MPAGNGTSHFLVGQPMNGSIVVSCTETKSPSGGNRWIKIHREFKLKNGARFWLDKLVSREKSNETLADWLKEQAALKAKKEAAQAKAREMARLRMQSRVNDKRASVISASNPPPPPAPAAIPSTPPGQSKGVHPKKHRPSNVRGSIVEEKEVDKKSKKPSSSRTSLVSAAEKVEPEKRPPKKPITSPIAVKKRASLAAPDEKVNGKVKKPASLRTSLSEEKVDVEEKVKKPASSQNILMVPDVDVGAEEKAKKPASSRNSLADPDEKLESKERVKKPASSRNSLVDPEEKLESKERVKKPASSRNNLVDPDEKLESKERVKKPASSRNSLVDPDEKLESKERVKKPASSRNSLVDPDEKLDYAERVKKPASLRKDLVTSEAKTEVEEAVKKPASLRSDIEEKVDVEKKAKKPASIKARIGSDSKKSSKRSKSPNKPPKSPRKRSKSPRKRSESPTSLNTGDIVKSPKKPSSLRILLDDDDDFDDDLDLSPKKPASFGTLKDLKATKRKKNRRRGSLGIDEKSPGKSSGRKKKDKRDGESADKTDRKSKSKKDEKKKKEVVSEEIREQEETQPEEEKQPQEKTEKQPEEPQDAPAESSQEQAEADNSEGAELEQSASKLEESGHFNSSAETNLSLDSVSEGLDVDEEGEADESGPADDASQPLSVLGDGARASAEPPMRWPSLAPYDEKNAQSNQADNGTKADDPEKKKKKKKRESKISKADDGTKKKKGKSKIASDPGSASSGLDAEGTKKKKKKTKDVKKGKTAPDDDATKKKGKKKRKDKKGEDKKGDSDQSGDFETVTEAEKEAVVSNIHSQLEAMFDVSDQEASEDEAEAKQSMSDLDAVEARRSYTQEPSTQAEKGNSSLDDSAEFNFSPQLLGPLDDYSSDEPPSDSDDDFEFQRVPGVDDFNNSSSAVNAPLSINEEGNTDNKIKIVSEIVYPMSSIPHKKGGFVDLDEVKGVYPNFSKIMGVWVDREKKLLYKTPLETVEPERTTKKIVHVPIAPASPTLGSMVKKWESKLVKQEAETAEVPPRKLRNVWAEKLEFSKPFTKPSHHKSEDEIKLIEDTVEKNFAFKDLTRDEMAPLVDAFERVEYEANALIGDQGEPECFYSIVQSGEVQFHSGGDKVGTAMPGDAFGELSLLYSCPRPAEVRVADNQTVLFQIDQSNFRHILREQMIRSQEEKLALLKSVEVFRQLDESDLRQLGSAMVPHKFQEGDNLSSTFMESPFCLVQEGSVTATDVPVGPGESFGADSLVKKESNKYEVKALSDGLAFTIDRSSFEKVFGDFERVSRKYREKQTLASIRQIRAAKLEEEQLDTLVRQLAQVNFNAGEVIFEFNAAVTPALYLVRFGKVKIVRKSGEEKTIVPGEYFGHEYMLFTSKQSKDIVPDHVVVKYSAVALEPTVCGVLTLEEVGIVSGRIQAIQDIESSKNIALEDLQRHRVLGEGQFGIVWLVSVKTMETDPYALKIQFLDDPCREDPAECIRDEIKMMRAVQHPFIIKVINTYEDPETISMLLSLAPGGELFDILHRQDTNGWWVSGLAEPIAKFYAMVVADTLAFMHRQNFVYRDLKPENVLIDKDGYPILTDFGFVKKLEGEKTYTFCGTPNYVAPEIVANTGHDMSADNWSLGVLIYELLDGANPFWEDGMDQQTLYELISEGLYPPIPKKRCSRTGRDLIDRLLEKDPSKRLGTFREKDILEHPWFADFDMEELRSKVIRAPWVPDPISLEEEEELQE